MHLIRQSHPSHTNGIAIARISPLWSAGIAARAWSAQMPAASKPTENRTRPSAIASLHPIDDLLWWTAALKITREAGDK